MNQQQIDDLVDYIKPAYQQLLDSAGEAAAADRDIARMKEWMRKVYGIDLDDVALVRALIAFTSYIGARIGAHVANDCDCSDSQMIALEFTETLSLLGVMLCEEKRWRDHE